LNGFKLIFKAFFMVHAARFSFKKVCSVTSKWHIVAKRVCCGDSNEFGQKMLRGGDGPPKINSEFWWIIVL
jgi:hypothetical protein